MTAPWPVQQRLVESLTLRSACGGALRGGAFGATGAGLPRRRRLAMTAGLDPFPRPLAVNT